MSFGILILMQIHGISLLRNSKTIPGNKIAIKCNREWPGSHKKLATLYKRLIGQKHS